MKRTVLLAALLVGCGGGSSEPDVDAPGGGGGDDDAAIDASTDVRPPDPSDPVVDVPVFSGAYSFAKLTTEDSIQFNPGTFFNDSVTEHEVVTQSSHYARYRDSMLLQDKNSAKFWIYNQATTAVSAPVTLPSDAVGRATIRGGFVYVGGLARMYSYEIATQMWRMREIAGTGTCIRVVAAKSRLFALCASTMTANAHELFSMWANKTMSDVVPLGTVSPVPIPEFTWITAPANADVAYFSSRSPDGGCIGKATATTLAPCAIAVRTLETYLATATLKRAEATDNGANLFVSLYLPSDTSDTRLFELRLSDSHMTSIQSIDSNAFATCPDNAVVYQHGVGSGRYAGGVKTDVRLGAGGDNDMACPLRPL